MTFAYTILEGIRDSVFSILVVFRARIAGIVRSMARWAMVPTPRGNCNSSRYPRY